jgi:hypothetical protein
MSIHHRVHLPSATYVPCPSLSLTVYFGVKQQHGTQAGFFHAIDWSEQWIIGLLATHATLFVVRLLVCQVPVCVCECVCVRVCVSVCVSVCVCLHTLRLAVSTMLIESRLRGLVRRLIVH